jgi:hypothetical protein
MSTMPTASAAATVPDPTEGRKLAAEYLTALATAENSWRAVAASPARNPIRLQAAAERAVKRVQAAESALLEYVLVYGGGGEFPDDCESQYGPRAWSVALRIGDHVFIVANDPEEEEYNPILTFYTVANLVTI